jgi:hypothetical protein
MENSLPILRPLALARPRSAHRFEAFSASLQELVILSESALGFDTVSNAGGTLNTQGLSIRRVESAELLASRVWIDNWRSMLPCLVANRRLLTRACPNLL